jgi:hypothetical protein
MILAAFILIAGFFAIYTLLPYFEQNYRKKRLEFDETELENLTHRKNEILEALRDLEYDHKMRKISDQDYIQVKESLTQQAVDAMKEMDSLIKGSDRDETRPTDEHVRQRT